MSGTDDAFGAPKGTRDLLPPESWAWQQVIRAGLDLFARYGYAPVETPMFEHTEVFERGVGETTEVVGKQMYTFPDRGGRSLTLRPEGTASVMRAVLEHNLTRGALPLKLSYAGPMFRQERPQKGRYRQFWQIGIEAIGAPGPLVDAEVIEAAVAYYGALGLEVRLLLNSIGHPASECRGGYIEQLRTYLRAREHELAPEDRERIATNPLRTFDSKEEATAKVMVDAPSITDHLCGACRMHHDDVRAALTELGIEFEEDPRLVRGLDYYTRTAFEFVSAGLGSQNAVGGGGRYDGLAEVLGGPHIPAIGFALGLDRILLALGTDATGQGHVDVYVVALGDDSAVPALKLTTRLRRAGLAADLDLMGRGMKGQMKDAARSGARWAAILGTDEVAAGEVTLKDLDSGDQQRVPLDELEGRLQR